MVSQTYVGRLLLHMKNSNLNRELQWVDTGLEYVGTYIHSGQTRWKAEREESTWEWDYSSFS